MMEHEWPQNWPELNPQLQEMAIQGSLPCAIVFAILRRLVENVATLASVANQRRRKDMHTAIVFYTLFLIFFLVNKPEFCNQMTDAFRVLLFLPISERKIYCMYV
ncbi:hypothetical protein NECAME_03675 [Necator americanus]|uniref:Exportin-1/Importin-beta-like domain-containing protein n=1 Tax=Necator americanus TaxID=51031 RepID=W2T1B5_NECAM|nr:hypothetical protein NECAME_03675 [Necator americanus]ETN75703.1 hypothetical protein NECAME_03675 [Necator americanus]